LPITYRNDWGAVTVMDVRLGPPRRNLSMLGSRQKVVAYQEPFKQGFCREVRITASAEDFREDWRQAPELVGRPLWWSKEPMRTAIESGARTKRRQSPHYWRWRPDSLDIDRCLIETRACGERSWTPVTDFSIIVSPVPGLSAVRIGSWIYISKFRAGDDGCETRYCSVMHPVHVDNLDYLLKVMADHPSAFESEFGPRVDFDGPTLISHAES
jgi:hypothetical protein